MSLPGNLLLVGGPFFVAEVTVLGLANYYEGSLTPGWVIHIILVCGVAAIVVSLLVWYTIMKPLLSRRRKRP
jgi:hypothetical protein